MAPPSTVDDPYGHARHGGESPFPLLPIQQLLNAPESCKTLPDCSKQGHWGASHHCD
jgi:hypothetical protein